MADKSFEEFTCDIISRLNSIDNYKLLDDIVDSYKKPSKRNNEPKHRNERTDMPKFNTPDFLHDMTEGISHRNEKPTKVIFHDPATIAYWPDGQKTVAKCMAGDKYDPELGLIICYMHRFAPQSFKSDIREFVSKEYRSAKKINHGSSSLVWVKKEQDTKETGTKQNKPVDNA